MVFLCGLFSVTSMAQEATYYGVKLGLGMNNQNWSGSLNHNLIFSPLIDVFAETHDPDSPSSLYAQLGFHQRGSALGFNLRNFATYRFNNIALEFGGKRKVLDRDKWDGYYLLGVRVEYTIFTNLGDANNTSLFNLVDEEFVRKFNYGATVGGGFEYELEDEKIFFVEVTFNPDLSAQYDQPFVLGPFKDPYSSTGRDIYIESQKVRNFSLELKIGYKWLR